MTVELSLAPRRDDPEAFHRLAQEGRRGDAEVQTMKGLDALDAEIARRESPEYVRFAKASPNQAPTERAGQAAVRGVQHGELIGLKLARELLLAALPRGVASPEPELLKDKVRALAFLTPEDWGERRGADPIARTINAVFDIIDEEFGR